MIFLLVLLDFITESPERGEDSKKDKRTERVIKGVVVLICCVLPCKQPFALASLMETSV